LRISPGGNPGLGQGVYPRPQESRFYAGLKIMSQIWQMPILIIMYGKAVFMNPIKDIL